MAAPTITHATVDERVARVRSLIHAIDAHDPDKVLAHFTDDVRWEDPSLPSAVEGHDAARAALAMMFRAFPDLHFTPRKLHVYVHPDENSAVATWEWTGTMTGPIDPPGYAPTGKKAVVTGACRYEFAEDGRIRNHIVIYDVLGLLQKLGLMPSLDSTPVKAIAGAQRLVLGAVQRLHR